MAVGALLVGSRSLAWVGPRFEWLAPTNRMWGPYYGFPLVVVTSRFRNAGGTVLRVGNERSTCVCTKLSKPPEELQPGEVGEIIMTVEQEPTVFPTQRGFGYVMTTSDPDNPVVVWSGVAEFEPTNVPAKMAGEVSASAAGGGAENREEAVAVDPGVFRLTNGGAGEVVEEIGRDFSATGEILVSGRGKVYGCGVDAEVELMGEASVVRLVLVDRGGRRYLVLESESAMNGRGRHGFDRHCEETCGLAGVEPMKVVVQVEQARVKVRRLYWVMRDMGKNKAELSKRQHEWKVAKLNERAETWRAGLTPQGCLSYEEKCRLFRGAEGSGLLPNLQGMEYYAGGIYTLRTNPPREARRRPPAWPPRMNWRLRHGYRLLTPVKDRGIGGESEAYALVAALECNLNIFYNQHLDVTLAEEDLVELSGAWGGNGVDVLRAVQYCHESGVIPTGCVVRSGGQGGEVRRCEDWKEWVVRSGGGYVTNGISNDELRRLLVRYGVIPVGVPEWEEMVVVVGWETNAYGEGAVWVVRSSFGPRWGDEGYMWLSCDAGVFAPVVVLTTPYEWGRRQIKTVCNDSDGDKYCAWGIAPVLPRSCCSCSCRSVQDFDDYDPQQGPHYPLN